MLSKRTEPFCCERSTSFMVMASTKFTEGSGLPTETGEPISLKLASPRVTEDPGSTDPFSTGIFALIDTQPINRIASEQIERNLHLLATMIVPLLPALGTYLEPLTLPKHILPPPKGENLFCDSGPKVISPKLWRFPKGYFYYKIIISRHKSNSLTSGLGVVDLRPKRTVTSNLSRRGDNVASRKIFSLPIHKCRRPAMG